MKVKLLNAAWKGVKSLCKTSSKESLLLERQNARKFVDSIPDETWDKISQSVFRQPGEAKSKILATLDDFKKYCTDQNIKLAPEVEEAYQTIEHKATLMADRLNVAVAKGKSLKNSYDYGKRFFSNNEKSVKILEKQLDDMERQLKKKLENFDDPDWSKNFSMRCEISSIKNDFQTNFMYGQNFHNPKIVELAKGILHDGQVFYHGTKHQSSIVKNGFHLMPKKHQAKVGSRELGEGVYLTPDKKVAAHYAGLRGGILHLDVKLNKVAAVGQDNIDNIMCAFVNNINDFQNKINPLKIELLIKELFKRNGFNAAYTKEAIGNVILQDPKLVDAIIGRKQSQLCVFDTSDIKILEKTFKDKAKNQALQIQNILELPLRMYNVFKEYGVLVFT